MFPVVLGRNRPTTTKYVRKRPQLLFKRLEKRPGTDHVVLGPMRGLEINYVWRGRIHISKYRHPDTIKELAKGPLL